MPKGWHRVRALALERDGWTCQLQRPFICMAPTPGGLRSLGKRDVHVDHIKPRAEGGANTLRNVRAACRACHEDRKRDPITPSRRFA